jgi:hypothetical protein
MLAINSSVLYYVHMENSHYLERDDRSDSFRMLGDVIASVAEGQHVTIDTTTRERWRDTLGLLREFDTLVDDTDIDRTTALQALTSFDGFSENYPSLVVPHLPAEAHRTMVLRTKKILEHGDVLASTHDIDKFVYHRKEEADETAELLSDCVSGDVATQEGFYTHFMPVLRSLGRAANFVDTFTDHRQDLREGKVQIEGSRQFYTAVGVQALKNLVSATPHVATPVIGRQFLAMSVMRLENRRKYGKTPYSSLKNLNI